MMALLLGLLGLALLWPVPRFLARSATALRYPAAALALWQLVGLASGVTAVAGLASLGSTQDGPLWMVPAVAAAGYLLAVTGVVTVRTLRRRWRHRDLLDLVGDPLPEVAGGLVLASPAPMAYCLPGWRPRLVVTSGALATLPGPALSAVLAHERAHLRQRHDLLILPFVAWHAALPFLPGAGTARASVALLIEVLADDAARAAVGPAPLAHALRSVSVAQAGSGAAGSADILTGLTVRQARLDGSLH
jgi:Zn-dependent protease with chaperone function